MEKNKLLSAALVLGLLTTVHAQNFTIRLAGGYAGPGFQNSENVLGPKIDPAAPQTDALVNMANINDSAKTYKQVHGSYGAGGNVTLAVGYMFNRFIGIDLAVSYAHSNTISCTNVRALPAPLTGYLEADISSYSYAVAVTPSIVLSCQKTKWKVYPYGRFGIVLPVAGKLTDNLTINSPFELNIAPFWLGNRTNVKLVNEFSPSLGFSGAVGVAYRPLPFMNVFVEVHAQYLQVRGKSTTVTEWTATKYNSDGTTTLVNDLGPTPGGRGLYRTQFNYVNQLTAQSNNALYNPKYDPNQPKQDLRPTSPGSYLGFNAGVTFFLGKKTLKKDSEKSKSKS